MTAANREILARALLVEAAKFLFIAAAWACLSIGGAIVVTLGAFWIERMLDALSRGLVVSITGAPEVEAPNDTVADILGWEIAGALTLWLLLTAVAATTGYFLRPYAAQPNLLGT